LSAGWLALAFSLSVAPAGLARWGGAGLGFEGVPCLPLAFVPWIAIAGWPRGARARLRAASAVGLMLPALALALSADIEAGLPLRASIEMVAWGALLCAALAWAAERGAALHAGAWLALVPGCALLLAAWAFVGPASSTSAPASALAASPLAWSVLKVHELRAASVPSWDVPWGPLAVVAILAALAARGGSRAAR
jgi:hypothetical protein